MKKRVKTYGKKKSKLHKSPYFGGDGSGDSPSDDDELVQEPLVRLGEGLIVDWNEEAVQVLMDGEARQGAFTADPKNCPTLEDPELDKKRRSRSLRHKNGVTLSECLDEFGKEEVLSEMDTWYCPRCKEHRRASKKLELWKTPDILILHFKRFSSVSNRRDKLDVVVDFPIEGLDMTKRIVESDGKEEIYDLFAVDNHYGSLGGGHYTAAAKSFVDGEWYDYNDSSVSKIKDPTRVIDRAAYLLFYRRRSDKALGGEKFQEIVERMKVEEEEMSGDEDEQGNGQRLGVDSPSQNGSSSALAGVGATVPVQGAAARGGLPSPSRSPLQAGSVGLGGLGRTLGSGTTMVTAGVGLGRNNVPAGLSFLSPSNQKVDTQHIENLPDYQSALDDGAESAQPNMDDVAVNDGIELGDMDADDDSGFDEEMNLANSAFDSSRFDASGNLRSIGSEPWSFAGLNTGSGTANSAAADDDVDSVGLASDIVDNGSDASDGSRQARFDDFENAEVDEDYRESTPPPDLDESGAAGAVQLQDLHEDQLALKMARVARGTPGGIGAYEDALPDDTLQDLEIPMDGPAEEDESDAMEIHVEEGEGLDVSPKKL